MSRLDPHDPDLTLAELFRRWPHVAPVFIDHGMICVGCLIAPFHTVIDAVAEYELSEETFREELRRAVYAEAIPPRR